MTYQGMIWKKKTFFLVTTSYGKRVQESLFTLFCCCCSCCFWSIYSPTRVSTMLPQKSLFARTNRIPKMMLRVAIVDWISHKTAILKIGRFILSRWSSLVFLLRISFLIFAFLCMSVELHWLTIELFIIYNSWFLFIHRFIAE